VECLLWKRTAGNHSKAEDYDTKYRVLYTFIHYKDILE